MKRDKRKVLRELTYILCTLDILMGDIKKENSISGTHLWLGFSCFHNEILAPSEIKVMSRMKSMLPKMKICERKVADWLWQNSTM